MAIRVAGCLLILAALGTPPQFAAQSPKSDPAQVLRSFRFVATGSNSQPVTDLHPEEIQVSDQGKRHPLVFSRLLRAAPAVATLGPREFSNRASDQFSASTLILLDLLNENFTERGASGNEANQALRGLEHAENVFLFLLAPDATLFAVHAWPAAGAPAEPSSAPWTRQIGQLLDQALRQVERIKPTDLTAAPGLTVGPTYRALQSLGMQYATVPGQKRIIWVTHGIPLTVLDARGTVDFGPQLKQLGAELTRLGISLYTVHQQDRSGTGIASEETLQSLPPLTGGRWFENDAVGPAIVQAETDARATYQAGYYTPAKEADGKLHKLRVSTTRKGVRILAEEQYAADAPAEIAQSNLQLAESRPFETPDIGLRASFTAAGAATRFEVRVDPRDLLLQRAGDSYAGAFSLTFLFYNADGSRSASAPVVTNVSLTQEQLDAAIKDGDLAASSQTLPRGTNKVRVVVQDAGTGIAGSLDLPIGSALP